MAASVKPESSGKNYNYLVQVYMRWCREQLPPVDPFTAPLTTVANFLAWAHVNRDIGQSAVASFRSAISKIHIGFEGVPLGQSVAISNLVKGVGNVKPDRRSRKTRYADTWELAPVLEALAQLHPPQSIIENDKEEGSFQLFAKFLPGSKEKTVTMRSGLFIPALSEEESLDPVSYLSAYKDRTAKDVAAEDLECSPLWVSTRKPHPPVKLVTLATWLRKAMARGGVDTSVYKAHSIRSAVPAHLRKTKALSLGQILARGG